MPSPAEEADKLFKTGQKHSKSGFFSKPDWDAAADAFDKAAKIYQHQGNVDMTTKAWTGASHAHDKAGNGFFAGKALETLAQFLLDLPEPKDPKEAIQRKADVAKYYINAGQIYAYANKPDRQAEMLSRAARVSPPEKSEEASKMMIDAIDALENSEKHHLTLDMYRALILLQVRANMIGPAIQTIKRQNAAMKVMEQSGSAAKCGLEIVVLALYAGDYVGADREFKEATTSSYAFAHSKEQVTAYELLSAVEDRDDKRLKEALQDQTLQFITAEISRFAKKIKVSGFGNIPKKATPAGGAAPKEASAQPDEPEDEENIR